MATLHNISANKTYITCTSFEFHLVLGFIKTKGRVHPLSEIGSGAVSLLLKLELDLCCLEV